jgi:hypothetical protein
MTLESQYNKFLHLNPKSGLSFNEWKEVHGDQIKQAIIQMMQDDEDLGLYDYGWCKGNVVLPKEEPTQRLEKYSERFDNKNNQIVEGIGNPDTWGKRLVEEKNIFIGPFLLRNGFTKYKLENNIYTNPKCTINVLEDCYEVLFESEYGEVSTYTDSHSIIHLVGILTWNDLIDKNYKK